MAISISFFLVYSQKKIKSDKLSEKPVSIRAQIRYTRSPLGWSGAKRMGHEIARVQFTTPIKALPKYWASGRVKHQHPDAATINANIDAIATRAAELHARYLAAGAFPIPDDYIKQILAAHTEAPIISQKFFTDYDQYLHYLNDRRLSPKFVEKQHFVRAILARFQDATGYTLDYPAINRTFAARFAAWCAKNLPKRRAAQDLTRTAERYITDLKHFLNHAHREEWTTATTWRQIKTPKPARTFPVTVTPDEITRLAAITPDQLPDRADLRRGLIITRDWFIFATQTGIRWSDWQTQRLRIIIHTPRIINLQLTTEKTDTPLEIPLSAIAIDILERHDMAMPEGYPFTTTSRHLRTLARIAGINKHLTTHTARRTFCTTQEAAGVPRAYIMRITGHRREEDYLRYTGITFQLNADLMRRANPKMFKNTA